MLVSRPAPLFHQYLAEDFERIGDAVVRRCMAIDGKRCYLSGATGFFGKNLLALLDFLHGQGARFAVTALSRDPQRFLAEQPWCYRLPWLDLRAGDGRNPWPGEGPYDLLLHAATDTAATAHRDPAVVFDNILAGTRQALAFSEKGGVKRLLLTGSGAQYGRIPADVGPGITELSPIACDPTSPSSAYGEGKRVSELLAAMFAQKVGVQVVNTRCFAFVGPGLPLDGHFAIGNFIRDALMGRAIQLQTGGEARRSYLYGADLAVWLVLLLLETSQGATVNVGSDEAVRIRDLAERVSARVDPSVPVLLGAETMGEERRHYLPSITVARALGLSVWTDLDTAITRTADWHRMQAGASR